MATTVPPPSAKEGESQADVLRPQLSDAVHRLPLLSREKRLREQSSQIVSSSSPAEVLKNLQAVVTSTRKPDIKDVGLCLHWIDSALAECTFPEATQLMILQAQFIEKLLKITSEMTKKVCSRDRFQRTAIFRSRKSVREMALRNRESLDVDQFCTECSKHGITGLIAIAQLCHAAEAPLPPFPSSVTALVTDLFISAAVNAKPQTVNESLKFVFEAGIFDVIAEKIFTQTEFDEKLVPALQKLLLRSPLFGVQSVIPAVCCNKKLDTVKLASQPSLASSLNSQDANLRKQTAAALKLVLASSSAPAPANLVEQFKKVSNSEQRELYASVLTASKPAKGSPVPAALSLQAKREGSDQAIAVIAAALVSQITTDPETAKDSVETIKSGLAESRLPLRREWIIAVSKTPESQDMFKTELETAWADVNTNAAAARSLFPAAYALISGLKPLEIPGSLFAQQAIDHVGIHARDVQLIFDAAKMNLKTENAVSALIFACLHGEPQQRINNRADLGRIFSRSNTEITFKELNAAVQALKQYKSPESGRLVASIKHPEWPRTAFIIAHERETVPPKGWIGLCLDCQVDPNVLAKGCGEELFKAALESRNSQALASLAFVAPEYSVDRIIAVLETELVPEKMSSLDVKLLNSEKGTLVDDSPVGRQSRGRTTKKSDDAWEEELRAEIAAKRGELTKEQKEKLEAQDMRREELVSLRSKAEFACDVLKALASDAAKGAANTPALWIPAGLQLLLKVVNANAPGCEASRSCVASLSTCLSSRFPGEWKSRAAELLLQGQKADPAKLRSLMYMLNPVSDKRLLDEQSLAYMIPILVSFISRVASELSTSAPGEEDARIVDDGAENVDEETTFLILAFIGNQATVVARIPRGDLIGSLHELLAWFAVDRTAVKDCLSSIAQQTLFNEEELKSLLTSAISVSQEFVQTTALEILDQEVDLSAYEFCAEIWIAKFGVCNTIANDIFTENQMSLPENALDLLIPFFADKYAASHAALALSYAVAAIENKQLSEGLVKLFNRFRELQPLPVTGAKLPVGLAPRRADHSNERLAVLNAVSELVPHLADNDVLVCAEFIVAEGVLDSNSTNSAAALELGKKLIVEHGKSSADGLLPLFEERHVVLFGFAAQYLPANDPRLVLSINRLLSAITENVESGEGNVATLDASVSALSALAPLAPEDTVINLLKELLQSTLSPTSTASRRASALGFAGLAYGLGLRVLGELDVITHISSASGDRKNAGTRMGAQQLVGALAGVFSSVFEPYALELMPEILTGLGDPQNLVRAPAAEAARKVMKLATSYGVGVLIPLALSQLDQTAWRSKKGAVELLGSMAFLNPRQLSNSLATIVPEIVTLLSDTHKEVRAAANASMRMFGDVIQNPEIQLLVPSLLKAVSNPTDHTDVALTELLKTRFVHYIDSPSLALVIFVVQRGLRNRSASTKRKACQIVGNMSILTSSEDLAPYLPAIMPDLEVAMTDPVPQTCAVACKALGVLVEKLGEDVFPNVVPNMFDKLRSSEPEAIGERWGTAQGLAEVLHGLGVRRLERELPEIRAGWQSRETHIRQGFAPLLLLLPGSFGASLSPYLNVIVPAVLSGLADTVEDIRDCALKAGRRIVKGYSSIAMDLLLPELEVGLWSSSWRIRLASVELVGDLLNELLGKGVDSSVADRMKSLAIAKPDENGEIAEEDVADVVDEQKEAEAEAEAEAAAEGNTASVEESMRGLDILGSQRRDRVLSSLFVCRADIVGSVRQAALDIWVSLIQNTPRVVKSILPTLVQMIVKHLGDEDEEIQRNASRALAELVRRVSSTLDNVLPTLVHLLPDKSYREGICHGLVELIPATQLTSLKTHEAELMRVVRACLQDENDATRVAATRALEQLHSVLGDVAGDMLPEMVSDIVENNDESSLAAINEMLTSTESNTILAAALPPLLKKISETKEEFHALAVAQLCKSAGSNDTRPFAEEIVDTFIHTQYIDTLGDILLVSCPENHLLSIAKRDDTLRARVFTLMAKYYSQMSNFEILYVHDWITFSLHGLEHENTSEAARTLLQSITASPDISKQELANLSSTAYQTLSVLSEPVPAFSEPPKGPAFILPIFLNGLVLGTNLQKEQSALAIAEIIRRTKPVEALKPVVTQITGPLIRIVGERAPAEIKAAIIYTLNELLAAIPLFLKPFLPQLQRTFAKNLGESSSVIVRARSATALATLVKHQTRIDPLAREVIAGIRSTTDEAVRATYLSALQGIIRHAGSHLGEAERSSVFELISDASSWSQSGTDVKLLSLLARIGADLVALSNDPAVGKKLVDSLITSQGVQSVLTANALFVHAPQVATLMANDFVTLFINSSESSLAEASEYAVRGLGKVLLTVSPETNATAFERAVNAIINVIPKRDGLSEESRRLGLVALSTVVNQKGYEVLKPYWNTLVPPLFLAVRDTNIPVKIAAEVTFLAVFDFAARQDQALFDEFVEKAEKEGVIDARQHRSMSEYVRRVAMRAAHRIAESDDMAKVNAESDKADVWAVGTESQ